MGTQARSKHLVYLFLGVCWLAIVGWQVAEHARVRRSALAAKLNHARDLATSLGVVIRSQRMFGTVNPGRLVQALEALARSRELLGIALLNPAAEIVASGGQSIPDELISLEPHGVTPFGDKLLVTSLVELGLDEYFPPRPEGWSETDEAKASSAVLWEPDTEGFGPPPGMGPGPPGRRRRDSGGAEDNAPAPGTTPDAPVDESEATDVSQDRSPSETEPPPPAPPATPEQEQATRPRFPPAGPGRGGGRPEDWERIRAENARRWRRMVESHPFWLSPEKYREAYEKQGLHMMTLMLDYTTSISALRRDLFMRFGMSLIALAAMAGFALAWSGMTRSSELRVRLAQARATNDSLRELNLAAAGLAHETRNPLNLVRGVAQMIVRDESVSETARDHLATVVQEVDRVTATLNEFIDYSKPREPRFAVVDPLEVGRHVARTLESDLEAKGITFTCEGHPVSVRADATMLRQCLFNLILNATQAVDAGGHISFRVERDQQGVRIGVIDDGPGVPPEAREDIFRPYFTLNERGSGLGLAVVRQVAAAHGWAIRYLPQEPRGSEFRISGIREAAEGET